jgi:hypothetical protein
MTKLEKDTVEKMRLLSVLSRDTVMSHIDMALIAEQAIKRQYGLDREPTTQAEKTA